MDVNYRSTSGCFLFPYESGRACHPERRRREGSAFPQMRRTCLREGHKQVLRYARVPRASLRMTRRTLLEGKRKREGGFPLSTPRSERACHPERRRLEGPAFPQMRRTCLYHRGLTDFCLTPHPVSLSIGLRRWHCVHRALRHPVRHRGGARRRRLHAAARSGSERSRPDPQLVRRQSAYIGSDQLRHRLLAGEPIPDFARPHSKLLSESHLPPGDTP